MNMDLGKAQRDLKATAGMKGEEKLQALRGLKARVHAFEMEAAGNFSIPFEVVKGWRDLLTEILPGISRLEAGRRRASAA